MRTPRLIGFMMLTAAGLALSRPFAANAQSINSPTTIDYITSGSVTIGDTNMSAFTVSLVPGGFVSGGLTGYHNAINSYLSAYGDTLVNFSGGSIGIDLNTQNNAVANVQDAHD